MNLNEIRLPPKVIADLYKKSLIEIPVITNASITVASEGIPTNPFKFMGNNFKQIFIVVYYPDQIFLPAEQLIFLSAVLKACNLSLEDTAIVNFATFKPDYNLIRQWMLPRIMLFFGVSAEFITVSSKPTEYEQTNFKGIATLYIPALERLNQNNNEGRILKKKLWTALKQLFESTGN